LTAASVLLPSIGEAIILERDRNTRAEEAAVSRRERELMNRGDRTGSLEFRRVCASGIIFVCDGVSGGAVIDGIPWDRGGTRQVFKRRVMSERQVARNILLHASTELLHRIIILRTPGAARQDGQHHQFPPLDNSSDKFADKQTSRHLGSSFFRRLVGSLFLAFDEK